MCIIWCEYIRVHVHGLFCLSFVYILLCVLLSTDFFTVSIYSKKKKVGRVISKLTLIFSFIYCMQETSNTIIFRCYAFYFDSDGFESEISWTTLWLSDFPQSFHLNWAANEFLYVIVCLFVYHFQLPTKESKGYKFKWDNIEKNIILGSFFWGYVLTELPGWSNVNKLFYCVFFYSLRKKMFEF